MTIRAQEQLASFLAKFEPAVAKCASACVRKLRQRYPGAAVLVYDNYNALAVAFGTSEKRADLLFSIAVYPKYPSLFLMNGPALDDPEHLLEGGGSTVRHIKLLDGPKVLDRPAVRALLAQAVELAPTPLPKRGGTLTIRSISKKQRPRR
jgi:hypothetical protein